MVVALVERVEAHEIHVAAAAEVALLVEHERDAATHAGREVAPGGAEHHHPAAGHVLAAVVADPLDHRGGARVAHGEALAGEPVEEGAAAGGPVEHRVADDHVVLGVEGAALGRHDGHHAAGEALADVVVRLAAHRDRHARGQPGAEALPGRAVQEHLDRALWQTFRPAGDGDRARQHPAHRTVDVAHVVLGGDPLAVRDRPGGGFDQVVVEGVVEHRRLRTRAPPRRVILDVGRREHQREVHAAGLPVLDRVAGLQQVDPAHEVLEAADAEARHQLAGLLGHHEEEVDHVLGQAGEALAQLGVLRGDAHRAGVEVADAHHDAAEGDQRWSPLSMLSIRSICRRGSTPSMTECTTARR